MDLKIEERALSLLLFLSMEFAGKNRNGKSKIFLSNALPVIGFL